MDPPQASKQESGTAQLALLIAVALGAAGAGIWSELYGQGATTSKSVTRQVSASASDATSYASGNINEQPDGTVWASASAWNTSGQQVDFSSWDAEGRVTVQGGMAPNNGPAATGVATGAGTLWDWNNSTMTPVTVDVTVGVQAATADWGDGYYGAFNRHQLQVQDSNWNEVNDPVAVRVHQNGSEAWTSTGGSVEVRVDGQPFAAGSGGSGQLQESRTHTVQKVF
jgi:hypothetical protein